MELARTECCGVSSCPSPWCLCAPSWDGVLQILPVPIPFPLPASSTYAGDFPDTVCAPIPKSGAVPPAPWHPSTLPAALLPWEVLRELPWGLGMLALVILCPQWPQAASPPWL